MPVHTLENKPTNNETGPVGFVVGCKFDDVDWVELMARQLNTQNLYG